jgi:hypothetical protein
MGLAYSQIDDAVLLTQQNLVKRGAFLDLQTDLSDHVAVREMWKGRQKKFSGGHPWRFDAQTDHNHSARTVGLFETDGSSINDTMKKGEVDVRHVNAHYIYDQREPDFQRGGHAIVDLVRTRYVAMMVSLYELMEELLWGKPTDSNDSKTPFGIDYWVVKNDGTATDGSFRAVNPSGFTSGRADIDSSTYTRWANWSAQYAEITPEDLIRKMRRGHRKSRFRSPVSHSQPELGAMRNGCYTNDDVLGLMEELLEQRNMNLGNDLASKDGRVMFKGTPVTYVPYLDSDANDPVYLLDWKWLAIGVMPGWENNLTKPYMVPEKHTVRRVDLDCSMNMICTNLRRQAVFSKA